MDTMPSSEFRKRYASLTEPVSVTVNGHGIGVWMPAKIGTNYGIDPITRPIEERPFRPVPKPSKRR